MWTPTPRKRCLVQVREDEESTRQESRAGKKKKRNARVSGLCGAWGRQAYIQFSSSDSWMEVVLSPSRRQSRSLGKRVKFRIGHTEFEERCSKEMGRIQDIRMLECKILVDWVCVGRHIKGMTMWVMGPSGLWDGQVVVPEPGELMSFWTYGVWGICEESKYK